MAAGGKSSYCLITEVKLASGVTALGSGTGSAPCALSAIGLKDWTRTRNQRTPQPRAAIALSPDLSFGSERRKDNMQKLFLRTIQVSLAVVCLAGGMRSVAAQSTIFNIPSTDVQAPRKVYLEADFITHFASYKNGGYQTYEPRIVVGLPGKTEVGVNLVYTHTSPAGPMSLQPNFKWQFYANEKRGLALAAGVIISTPITRRREGRTTGMLYLIGSKDFTGRYGPKVTFGGYSLVGNFDDGTDKAGVLAGFEQPVTKRFSFVTDWFSGNNNLGYVTAGTGITLSPKQNIYAGYSFGNQGRGNNSLGVYYGYTF
jgi:hypothetical protein